MKQCKICSTPFESQYPKAVVCSDECRDEWRRKKSANYYYDVFKVKVDSKKKEKFCLDCGISMGIPRHNKLRCSDCRAKDDLRRAKELNIKLKAQRDEDNKKILNLLKDKKMDIKRTNDTSMYIPVKRAVGLTSKTYYANRIKKYFGKTTKHMVKVTRSDGVSRNMETVVTTLNEAEDLLEAIWNKYIKTADYTFMRSYKVQRQTYLRLKQWKESQEELSS